MPWNSHASSARQMEGDQPTLTDRYQSGSIVITIQLPVNTWHDVIDEPTFADAILDRLIHNAHRLPLDGPSLKKTKDAEVKE